MGEPNRMLTFRSGGYVLVLAGFVSLALVFWAVSPAIFGTARTSLGDGRDIDTYGFDLANLQVPRELVFAAMKTRDLVHPIDTPILLSGAGMDRLNQTRGKFVLGSDRVIGVEIDGETRAYPISILNVHEVIHDVLGGRPIAVTYHWPCDSVMVFDREVDGRVLAFGLSGLLYNSNMLMYDRSLDDSAGGESLWSQLLARAVSGPAAGRELTVVPSTLTSWSQWLERHPETTVVDRDPSIVKRRYAKAAPEEYFRLGRVSFPVSPMPVSATPPPLTPVVAVLAGEERRVYPYPLVRDRAGDLDTWTDRIGDLSLIFGYDQPSRTVSVRVQGDEPASLRYCLWFAWHAMHPEDPLVE